VSVIPPGLIEVKDKSVAFEAVCVCEPVTEDGAGSVTIIQRGSLNG
jgi:hypothetical protein